MTFQQFNRELSARERELKNMPHPIWRGIGFLLILVLPIFSFALADLLVNEYFTSQFLPYFPDTFQSQLTLFLIYTINNFWGVVVVSIIVLLLLSFTLLTITSILFKSGVGEEYNKFDAPRPKPSKKKKKKLYKSKF